MRYAPYDELNVIRERVSGTMSSGLLNVREKRNEIGDIVFEYLTWAYLYGVEDANEAFGTDILSEPLQMVDTIYKPIAGQDFRDRIDQYVNDDGTFDAEGILNVAETEMTRDYNTGVYDTGKSIESSTGRKVGKRWITMVDSRVRDTHKFLHGVVVGVDESFVTTDGDSAMAPGGFEKAENNVGCRCYIELSPLK